MPIYKTTGQLTGVIEAENIGLAQEYLSEDEMAQYLEGSLKEKIETIRWTLAANGRDYSVEAFALSELTVPELAKLADWVSGQNSDGLGEGFEQQDFAWAEDTTECGECDGCENNYSCEDDSGHMISFDWKTNDSKFVRV